MGAVATPFTLVATATGSTTPDFEGLAAFLTLVVTNGGGWTIDGTRSGGRKDVILTLNLSWGVVSSGALSSRQRLHLVTEQMGCSCNEILQPKLATALMGEGPGLVNHNIEGADDTHAAGVRVVLFFHRVLLPLALEPMSKHCLCPRLNPRLHTCQVGGKGV